MKCKNCDADLTEGTIKCPFCKDILTTVDNPMFENFNFKYTITSDEQIKIIRNAANEEKSSLKSVLKKGNRKRKKFRILKKNKDKKSRNSSFLNSQIKMNITFFGGIFLVILLIWGIISGIGALINGEKTVNPIVYSKDNSLFLFFDKKEVLLTENAIDMNSAFTSSEIEDDAKISDIIKKANLFISSENGMFSYYFENYDINTNSGSLNLIYKGKKKKALANGVYNSLVLSPDGEGVLFLQSADKNGDMGNLCYLNSKMDEPRKIANDIDKNTFMFSENGKYILFIKNYNYSKHGGDLCFVSAEKEEESVTIDSNVYAVYGSNIKEDKFIYAKDYNKDKKMHNLYLNGPKSDLVKLFEGAVKKPVLPEKGDTILTYAFGDGKMNEIYSINLKNLDKTKVASQATEILLTDEKNESILYNKVYDRYITDCYFYKKGKKTVKAADNVAPAPSKYYFSYSKDFKKSVYISGFDKNRNGGTLFLTDLSRATENLTEIASDVYMCRISEDAKEIIYAKDYSKERDTFDLYVYKNNKSSLIKEDVDASYYNLSADRKYIYYIENHDMKGPYGTLKGINLKGKEVMSFDNVWAFDCFGDDGVLFYTDYVSTSDTLTVHVGKNGSKKAKVINSGIDSVIYH